MCHTSRHSFDVTSFYVTNSQMPLYCKGEAWRGYKFIHLLCYGTEVADYTFVATHIRKQPYPSHIIPCLATVGTENWRENSPLHPPIGQSRKTRLIAPALYTLCSTYQGFRSSQSIISACLRTAVCKKSATCTLCRVLHQLVLYGHQYRGSRIQMQHLLL